MDSRFSSAALEYINEEPPYLTSQWDFGVDLTDDEKLVEERKTLLANVPKSTIVNLGYVYQLGAHMNVLLLNLNVWDLIREFGPAKLTQSLLGLLLELTESSFRLKVEEDVLLDVKAYIKSNVCDNKSFMRALVRERFTHALRFERFHYGVVSEMRRLSVVSIDNLMSGWSCLNSNLSSDASTMVRVSKSTAPCIVPSDVICVPNPWGQTITIIRQDMLHTSMISETLPGQWKIGRALMNASTRLVTSDVNKAEWRDMYNNESPKKILSELMVSADYNVCMSDFTFMNPRQWDQCSKCREVPFLRELYELGFGLCVYAHNNVCLLTEDMWSIIDPSLRGEDSFQALLSALHKFASRGREDGKFYSKNHCLRAGLLDSRQSVESRLIATEQDSAENVGEIGQMNIVMGNDDYTVSRLTQMMKTSEAGRRFISTSVSGEATGTYAQRSERLKWLSGVFEQLAVMSELGTHSKAVEISRKYQNFYLMHSPLRIPQNEKILYEGHLSYVTNQQPETLHDQWIKGLKLMDLARTLRMNVKNYKVSRVNETAFPAERLEYYMNAFDDLEDSTTMIINRLGFDEDRDTFVWSEFDNSIMPNTVFLKKEAVWMYKCGYTLCLASHLKLYLMSYPMWSLTTEYPRDTFSALFFELNCMTQGYVKHLYPAYMEPLNMYDFIRWNRLFDTIKKQPVCMLTSADDQFIVDRSRTIQVEHQKANVILVPVNNFFLRKSQLVNAHLEVKPWALVDYREAEHLKSLQNSLEPLTDTVDPRVLSQSMMSLIGKMGAFENMYTEKHRLMFLCPLVSWAVLMNFPLPRHVRLPTRRQLPVEPEDFQNVQIGEAPLVLPEEDLEEDVVVVEEDEPKPVARVRQVRRRLDEVVIDDPEDTDEELEELELEQEKAESERKIDQQVSTEEEEQTEEDREEEKDEQQVPTIVLSTPQKAEQQVPTAAVVDSEEDDDDDSIFDEVSNISEPSMAELTSYEMVFSDISLPLSATMSSLYVKSSDIDRMLMFVEIFHDVKAKCQATSFQPLMQLFTSSDLAKITRDPSKLSKLHDMVVKVLKI